MPSVPPCFSCVNTLCGAVRYTAVLAIVVPGLCAAARAATPSIG